MTSKIPVLSIDGEKIKEIDFPSIFSEKIREDIVAKILETKKTKQPYSPSIVAGKQHAASGKMVHRRHVWRSGYGRGMSRIPRKILLRRGTQFNLIAAEVSSTRGGRRAHPPKVISMINTKKINKKEMKIAMLSALSATADKKRILSKYSSLSENNLKNIPIIVEPKIISLKTKEFISSLKKILGNSLAKISFTDKKIRSGKGKFRGRKYKKNAGAIIITGENEKMKANIIESKNTRTLGVQDIAKGGLGRIVIYTESAIKELQEKLNKTQDKLK